MPSSKPVRKLSAVQLGVGIVGASSDDSGSAIAGAPVVDGDATSPLFDSLYAQVRLAMDDGYAGVVLSGPPGTSKTWFASQLAERIAGDPSRVSTVQFHASYNYEDFMEGWVADGSGGFRRARKVFLLLCDKADADPVRSTHVLVIDEISRADVSRVFGEALTYIESSLRGVPFLLSSGSQVQVPPNLFVIATMNPWDMTVSELDFAVQRRFAFIELQPSTEILREMLLEKEVEPSLVDALVRFLEFLNRRQNPLLKIGHAYFSKVRDFDSAERLWVFQLRPHVARVTRLDPAELQAIEGAWGSIVSRPAAAPVVAGVTAASGG